MLKLTIKPGEYIDIGQDIRIVYTGGSSNNIHLLVDAPRELDIVRSKVLERKNAQQEAGSQRYISSYYKDRDISDETKEKIVRLIMEEKKKGNMQR